MQTGEIKSIKYKNGNVYGGKIDDNKPHGKGVMTETGGTKYEGNFKDGERDGNGMLKYANGDVYNGEFKDGRMHGQGVVQYANGDSYTGQLQGGKPHGKGVMTETGGTKYEGNFKDGIIHGTGVMKYANGRKYNGEFRNGNAHGIGMMKYKNGACYNGEWKDGIIHGTGVMKYKNGDVYNGEFKDGRIHGTGVYTYANGDSYTGQLQGGKPHGTGVMQYASGACYNGEWKDGRIHGTGVMKYKNGDVYNGEFNDGRIFVDVKQKNPSTKKTVLFQSSQLKKAEDKQWGHGRFIDQNHLITRYNGIENANEVIAKLNNLAEVNEGASTKFKVVFDQHGGEQGWNDIKVDTESAEQMLKMLYSKGYRDITVSDLSCHGGTASHFKEISQAFVNTNPDINVTIRASVEGRTVIPCDSNNGTKFRTIGKDGEVLKREKTVYKSNLTQIVGGNTNEESKESSLLHKNTTMKNASITKSLNNRQ